MLNIMNSGKWKKIVFVLIAAAAAALLAGGCVYYAFAFPGNAWNCLWMSLQNCMESLLFNPILPIQDIAANEEFMNCIGRKEQVVMILYALAMVLAPFIDILIIFSVLDSFLHLFVGFGFGKRRILIVGYNDDVRSLIERRSRNGKVWLWTENYLSAEEERELYFKRVAVKMNDFSLCDSPKEYQKRKTRFHKFIKSKKITDVLLLDSSDVKNIQYYMALSSLDVCEERTVHFYVLNRSFEMRNMLQDFFDQKLLCRLSGLKDENGKIPKDVNTHMDLRIFNFDQIQAELMFSKLPVLGNLKSETAIGEIRSKTDKNVHVLITGSDRLCMHIALHAMNQAVLSSDNKIVIDIVHNNISDIRDRLGRHFNKDYVCHEDKNKFEIDSGKNDGSLVIRLSECDMTREALVPLLRNLQKDDGGKFTYLAFAAGDANENLNVFKIIDDEEILGKDCKTSVPVAVRMTYSEEMEQYLGDPKSFVWCKEVYLMGANEEYISLDQIIHSEEEEYIRKYNFTYDVVSDAVLHFDKTREEAVLRAGNTAKANADCNQLEEFWNQIVYYKRQSNRALYYHKAVKAVMFGDCEEEMRRFLEEGKKDGETWSERLIAADKEGPRYPKLLEIAKTEHRRFVYFHASEGWGYHEGGKNPGKRLHNCLCPWKTLEEREKTERPNILIYDLISSPSLMGDTR